VLELIMGTALGMRVEVIGTDLTLAESVPALAGEVDRSRRELAQAHEAAADAGRRLGRA
jgi:FMN-dependent NADH-azoreductase